MMKKIISTFAITASLLLSTQANAVIIDASTAIPDENILLNFNGLDWVYAGPIGTGEWAMRPDWTDFIIGDAIINPDSGFGDHSLYRFASEYWSNFNHIDLSDAAMGLVTNGFDIGSLEDAWETWYVRDSRTSSVPESSSIALLGLGLFGLLIARRKKNQYQTF